MRAEARHEYVERVSIDSAVMAGAPCIRGTRIPVATIVGMLAEGVDRDEVLQDYPQLSAADVTAALRYTATAGRQQAVECLTPPADIAGAGPSIG